VYQAALDFTHCTKFVPWRWSCLLLRKACLPTFAQVCRMKYTVVKETEMSNSAFGDRRILFTKRCSNDMGYLILQPWQELQLSFPISIKSHGLLFSLVAVQFCSPYSYFSDDLLESELALCYTRDVGNKDRLTEKLFYLTTPSISKMTGRDNSAGIATRGLDGPGIESRLGENFPHRSRPALGPTHSPVQWVPGLFPGAKAAETWRWTPTPGIAQVKERVELYLYSPSGLSWYVIGRPLPFKFCFSFVATYIWKWRIYYLLTHWHTQPAVRRAEPSMPLLLILALCQ
jgi:hypothetical protein